jgi:chaperone modulatory protein CbpM
MPGAKGKPAGDAYVEIRVQPHPFFEPRDNDIHVELPVTLERSRAGRPDQGADVGGPVMLNFRPAPTPASRSAQGPRPARPQVQAARRPVREAQGRAARAADDKLKAFLETGSRARRTIRARRWSSSHDQPRRAAAPARPLTTMHVERWVARGLLRPAGRATPGPSSRSTWRARACWPSSSDDLGFDDEAVETIVGLVDQVHTLRGQLDLLARAIAEQPPTIREAIAGTLRRLGRSRVASAARGRSGNRILRRGWRGSGRSPECPAASVFRVHDRWRRLGRRS